MLGLKQIKSSLKKGLLIGLAGAVLTFGGFKILENKLHNEICHKYSGKRFKSRLETNTRNSQGIITGTKIREVQCRYVINWDDSKDFGHLYSTDIEETTYDKQGRELSYTRSRHKDGDFDFATKSDHIDTADGRSTKTWTYSGGNEKPTNIDERYFDNQGRAIGYAFDHDADGKLDHIVSKSRYENGKLKKIIYDSNGDGVFDWLRGYIRDKDGNLLEQYVDEKIDGTKDQRWFYTRDNKGNLKNMDYKERKKIKMEGSQIDIEKVNIAKL